MSEEQLRVRLGLFLVTTHFVAIILLIVMYFAGGFLFDEMTTAVGLIAPLFAGYTTLIVKYIIGTRHDPGTTTTAVSPAFRYLSIMITAVFVMSIVGLILLKAFNVAFSDFDQFKTLLGIVEAAFAVYMGLIVAELFRPSGPQSQTHSLEPRPTA
jgi:hypothetical protein